MGHTLGDLCLIGGILGLRCGISHDLNIRIWLNSLQITRMTYIAQNHWQKYCVVIAHPNIALEWLVLCSQKFCLHQQLCLAQGSNCLVKNHVRSDPDLWRDGRIDKSINRAVPQLGEPVCGFCIVGPYMVVREGVKSREQWYRRSGISPVPCKRQG